MYLYPSYLVNIILLAQVPSPIMPLYGGNRVVEYRKRKGMRTIKSLEDLKSDEN